MEAQLSIQKKGYDRSLLHSVGQNIPQHLLFKSLLLIKKCVQMALKI
jgi:hypothetical protein